MRHGLISAAFAVAVKPLFWYKVIVENGEIIEPFIDRIVGRVSLERIADLTSRSEPLDTAPQASTAAKPTITGRPILAMKSAPSTPPSMPSMPAVKLNTRDAENITL